jgi:hypothetical protein
MSTLGQGHTETVGPFFGICGILRASHRVAGVAALDEDDGVGDGA